MTLKLSPQNAEALFNLFTTSVILRSSNELVGRLVLLHMVAVYKKLRNKYEGIPRKVYTLNLTLPEAIAYRIYWRDIPVPLGCDYEWSLIVEHCGQIDKELINFTTQLPQATKFLNQ